MLDHATGIAVVKRRDENDVADPAIRDAWRRVSRRRHPKIREGTIARALYPGNIEASAARRLAQVLWRCNRCRRIIAAGVPARTKENQTAINRHRLKRISISQRHKLIRLNTGMQILTSAGCDAIHPSGIRN